MLPGAAETMPHDNGHSLLLNPSQHNSGHSHHHSDEVHLHLERNILHENDLLAQRNRSYLEAKGIFALNMVSSPGSGKTTLLEKTITLMRKGDISLAIIEGDQQSMNDADRIAATGAPVVQINTGKGCHLDAHMVLHGMQKLELKNNSIIFIENVGNLVCPALFDLGENTRVVISSVTEGDDKPVKYPYMFESSQVCVINKIDLLPYVSFNVESFKNHASRINPAMKFFELSATTGSGLDQWMEWLKNQQAKILRA
jgi:hydrogenase nickel incorporation protein HypB